MWGLRDMLCVGVVLRFLVGLRFSGFLIVIFGVFVVSGF